MKQKDLKGLGTTEMMKCDGCGGYHPIEECEVVVIRLIKGKNCELKSTSLTALPNPKIPSFEKAIEDNHDVAVSIPQDKPRKNIIPPGIMGLMIDPGHPSFEAHGAKETRRT